MSAHYLPGEKVAILPARWGSSRFPGKPLAMICGKSLIQRAYESLLASRSLDCVAVATDDTRIMDHVLDFGGHCIMTSAHCANGTERVGEAVLSTFPSAEIIVNVQGDEPCISAETVDSLVHKLLAFPHIHVTTPVMVTKDPEEIYTNHKVKCVFDKHGRVLYFSRSTIPHPFKDPAPVFYLHMGAYAFRRKALFDYIRSSPTTLSQVEDLEQLRILEHGGEMHVCVTEKASPSVDYPEDINKVEKYLSCLSNVCS